MEGEGEEEEGEGEEDANRAHRRFPISIFTHVNTSEDLFGDIILLIIK